MPSSEPSKVNPYTANGMIIPINNKIPTLLNGSIPEVMPLLTIMNVIAKTEKNAMIGKKESVYLSNSKNSCPRLEIKNEATQPKITR